MLRFLFHAHSSDEALACRLLAQIRQFYPVVAITAIADGCHLPQLAAMCSLHNAIYRPREDCLKGIDYGSQWVEEFFKAAIAPVNVELPGFDERGVRQPNPNRIEFPRWVIKLDPDSFLHRPFYTLPPDDYCGNLQVNHLGTPYVRGGCMALSSDAIAKMLRLEDFHLDKYRSQDFTYRTPHGRKALTDFIIGDLAQRAEIAAIGWEEVAGGIIGNGGEPVPANTDLRYPVTHPVKELFLG